MIHPAEHLAAVRAAALQNAAAQYVCLPCKSPSNSGSCKCQEPCDTPDCPALEWIARPGSLSSFYPIPRFR